MPVPHLLLFLHITFFIVAITISYGPLCSCGWPIGRARSGTFGGWLCFTRAWDR